MCSRERKGTRTASGKHGNVCSLSSCLVTKSCLTLCNHRAPLSMGFFRQEYWRGLPFPSPGDPPDPGIEARSPAWRVDSLPLRHLGSSVSLAFLSTFPAPHSRGWSINACGIKPDALYMFYFC